jgi:hypothetical protein
VAVHLFVTDWPTRSFWMTEKDGKRTNLELKQTTIVRCDNQCYVILLCVITEREMMATENLLEAGKMRVAGKSGKNTRCVKRFILLSESMKIKT